MRVIIVDSRPQNEGRHLLQKLLRHGISCTYTHLNALSYVMEEATKVTPTLFLNLTACWCVCILL